MTKKQEGWYHQEGQYLHSLTNHHYFSRGQATMYTHPIGAIIEIEGTTVSDCSCSCEGHEACWFILTTDIVMQLQKVQVVIDGKKKTTIAVYWVTDGINRCYVGFLPHHVTRQAYVYYGLLAEVMDVFTHLCASPTKCKKYHHNQGCFKPVWWQVHQCLRSCTLLQDHKKGKEREQYKEMNSTIKMRTKIVNSIKFIEEH